MRSQPALRAAPPAISRRLPMPVYAAAVVLLLSFGFGPNFDLAALALVVFVAGWALLWRPGESAVLPITFSLHWLGAAIAVFHANWLDIEIFRYESYGGDMRRATMLSLVGIFCLAVGIRLGTGGWRPNEAGAARRIALAHPVARWFRLYAYASAAAFAALSVAWLVPGLSQVFLAVSALKWAFYFMLAYATFARGGLGGPYFAAAFFAELVLGVGGYFSEFRTVFLVTMFAAFASGVRITARMQAGLAVLVAVLIGFTVVWTGVKTEYRQFVSEGSREQVVSVDYATRIGKLAELTANLDGDAIERGVDQLIHRLSYVGFMSVVLGYVPDQVPHEDGALLADAVSRPFLPRILFPDKTAIDDTARSVYYTGGVVRESEGTSISLGYVAEAYIDFGSWGMMPALLGIGWAYGFAYRRLSRSRRSGPMLGMGLATSVLLTIGYYDTSITKSAGGFVVALLVAWLFGKAVAPLSLGWATGPGGGR